MSIEPFGLKRRRKSRQFRKYIVCASFFVFGYKKNNSFRLKKLFKKIELMVFPTKIMIQMTKVRKKVFIEICNFFFVTKL